MSGVNDPLRSSLGPTNQNYDPVADSNKQEKLDKLPLPPKIIQKILSYIGPDQELSSVSKEFNENRIKQLNVETYKRLSSLIDEIIAQLETKPDEPESNKKEVVQLLNELNSQVNDTFAQGTLKPTSVKSWQEKTNAVKNQLVKTLTLLTDKEEYTPKIESLRIWHQFGNLNFYDNGFYASLGAAKEAIKKLAETGDIYFAINECCTLQKNNIGLSTWVDILRPIIGSTPESFEKAVIIADETRDPNMADILRAAIVVTASEAWQDDTWLPNIKNLVNNIKDTQLQTTALERFIIKVEHNDKYTAIELAKSLLKSGGLNDNDIIWLLVDDAMKKNDDEALNEVIGLVRDDENLIAAKSSMLMRAGRIDELRNLYRAIYPEEDIAQNKFQTFYDAHKFLIRGG